MTDRSVPCGACRLCCKNEFVTLHIEEGDRPADYFGLLNATNSPDGVIYSLKHKPSGDCIALGPDGCTIYEKRPMICRTFDCRLATLKVEALFSRKEQREMGLYGLIDPPVMKRGGELLSTLSRPRRSAEGR